MTSKPNVTSVKDRPPVVAVVGHVDHGKTTLLDRIRNTNVASREHGGITQHIGAYQISLKQKGYKEEKRITFIDTPGHEAFTKMRSRGAGVADLAILVVAADDSVKPQTVESVEKIREAGIPMIVAANKTDLPTANLDKVKKDLAKIGVQVEGFGGDIPLIPISAKTGTGVHELLDTILLLWEMTPAAKQPEAPFEAVVIETRLDKGKGMVATLLVKAGCLTAGTSLYDGDILVGKVRAMFDESGTKVDSAESSKPVEVLGFSSFPTIGSVLSSESVIRLRPDANPPVQEKDVLPDFLKPISETRELNVILKADTAGSLEAVMEALPDKIRIVSSGVGQISDADILHAKSTRSFVIGFNVRAPQGVEKLAATERVVVRHYSLIYELLDELEEVVEGIAEVLTKERELGRGAIIAEFPFNSQRIAGTKVSSGRLARGDTVRITRGETEIGRTKIKSIRQGKNEINKAEDGQECGVLFDRKIDFQINDAIIAVSQI